MTIPIATCSSLTRLERVSVHDADGPNSQIVHSIGLYRARQEKCVLLSVIPTSLNPTTDTAQFCFWLALVGTPIKFTLLFNGGVLVGDLKNKVIPRIKWHAMNEYTFLRWGDSDFAKPEPSAHFSDEKKSSCGEKKAQFDSVPFKTEVLIGKTTYLDNISCWLMRHWRWLQYTVHSVFYRKQIRIQRKTEDIKIKSPNLFHSYCGLGNDKEMTVCNCTLIRLVSMPPTTAIFST